MSKCAAINSILSKLYDEMRSVSLNENLSSKLSAPLLLKVTNKWTESDKRILILGQETFGWQFDGGNNFQNFCNRDDSVKKLMNGYEEFCFAKEYRTTPFWRAYHEIRGSSRLTSTFETNTLWSNIIKFDISGNSILKSSEDDIQNLESRFSGFLKREIEIIQPTHIVAFSGHAYDRFIINEFGIEYSKNRLDENIPRREMAVFKFPSTTILRTYHPNYLQRSKKWQQYMDIIKQYLASAE